MTGDSDLKDHLGTLFEKKKDGSTNLTELWMSERIPELVGLNPTSKNIKMNDTPACSNDILENGPDGKPISQTRNYRSVVGCMSYYNSMVS